MTEMRYLDANATQPLRPAARDAVMAAFAASGNPSSVHQPGRHVRRIMEDAREVIAARFGGQPQDLVFTSGGTEADAAAIHAMSPGRRLVISAIEHDAVRSAAVGAAVAPVGRDGIVDLAMLEARLADGEASLVCMMLANNETGVIQPVREAAAVCRRHGALLHVDAIQAAGRMPVHLGQLGAHSLAISSHKLGGPAGVGALLLAPDAPFAEALIGGGGQERGRRGGTPSVALIAGFAAAAQASEGDDLVRLAGLRDAAEQAAVACGAVVCGDPAHRLPNTTCLALPNAAAGVQVIALDLEGIAVSAGAACSSGKVQTSHVLQAMGLGALAGQAIRVSLPWNVTPADIDAFVAAYKRVAGRLCPTLAPHAA
ncbi:cysteine desulfurase family protein [Acidisphaera sp. S103]|uniref:cysteine desulfurase family protein n=1 Tax=Acidisphaera sp. S103 TaxID=1747223 RepID=UPI00131AE207|nr:aminotransferase class V-fold PLP-dependent enzyme [Acidisphaera sp. S103]